MKISNMLLNIKFNKIFYDTYLFTAFKYEKRPTSRML